MEFPLMHEPAHIAAAENKRAIEAIVFEIAERAGAANPKALAEELCLIIEGTYITRQVTGNPKAVDIARRIAERLISTLCGSESATGCAISQDETVPLILFFTTNSYSLFRWYLARCGSFELLPTSSPASDLASSSSNCSAPLASGGGEVFERELPVVLDCQTSGIKTRKFSYISMFFCVILKE